MAKPDVTNEIKSIQKSLSDLETDTSSVARTVTAGSENSYDEQFPSTGTGQDHIRHSSDYVRLVVDAAISKTELNQERKLTQVQKEILGELGSLGKEIQKNKPNYLVLFLSLLFGCILTIAAIFVPIIPIYTENVVNGKLEPIKKSILDEVRQLVDQASLSKTGPPKK